MRTFSFLILAACGPTAAVNAVKPDCADLVVGQLEITEVMIDPVGADTGNEWFEVLNRTSHLQSLIGVTVFARDAAGAEKTFVLKSGEIVPHGSFTLGDTTQPVLPDWVAASYGKSLGAFSAAGGSVGLRCAGVVLAQVDWHSGTKSGRSRMLDPREPQWCDAPLTARYEGENHGTPGEPNPPCLSAPTCLVGDAGVSREVVAPTPSTLRITEIMAAPKAANDSVGEWFEVQATDELDLNGVVVATSTGISTLESQACLHVFAGQYAIIARSADPFVNGGLPNPTTGSRKWPRGVP